MVMPKQADEASRALWNQLAEDARFDPRSGWSQAFMTHITQMQ